MDDSASRLGALSDEELAMCCSKRPVDDEAWYAFYTRFHGYVRSLVWSRLGGSGSVSEIDDVVQQAFLKIFTALPKFSKEKAKLKTYLSRVVVNLVIDVLRHGARRRDLRHSLEEDLSVLQLYAAQDPEIFRQAAEHIVDRLADKSKVPLLRDVLRGETIQVLRKRHKVSVEKINEEKQWLHERLGEIPDKLPNY
jgi:RNA polymerase sigma factor (sigma-70 family)